jgi:CheY-like chemotaxis protein
MNSMKILLVDDSKSARYALRLQLQRHGMTVETVDAAETALERVRDTPPDAIFMDHTMPGMNGFEALEILKTSPSTAHIPVVMCTSNEDPVFLAQAREKGAMDILSKSAAPEKLGNLLDRLQQAEAPPEEGVGAAQASAADGRRHAETSLAAANAEDDERLDARIRSLIGSLMDDRAELLAEDLIAQTDERIEARVRAAVGPLMEDHAKRLAEDVIAKTNERLVSGLNLHAERLRDHFLKTQNEQAQLNADSLLMDRLPALVQEQLDEGKQNLAQSAMEQVDRLLDAAVNEPSFINRVLEAVEARITEISEQIAKRNAMEISETVAAEQADALTKLLNQAPSVSRGTIYLLTAGAALVGVASAAAVFLLLS